MASPFSIDNPVFSRFAFYSSVVVTKTLLMGEITAWTRIHRQAFVNEEDISMFVKSKDVCKVNATDPVVERIRRCHMNDLENVLPFVLVGLMYVSTKPGIAEATRVFQIFTVSRLAHTVVYLGSVRQPIRAIAYLSGYGATFFMLYKIFRAVW